METKKSKIVCVIIALACAATCALFLAACGDKGESHTHTPVAHEATAATCLATGNKAYWECSGCHKIFADADCSEEFSENGWITEKADHSYVDHAATEPTCVSRGNNRYYSCEVCGNLFNAFKLPVTESECFIAALGHSYGEWEVTAPTAETEGSAASVCTVCDENTSGHSVELTLPALTYAGYTVTDTATCTEPGEATYAVTIEGNEISFNIATLAKGHVLGELVPAVAATHDHVGNPGYYQCERCLKYFSDPDAQTVIPDADIVIDETHTYVEHAAVPATCEAGGNKKYYSCLGCDAYFDENQRRCEPDSWLTSATGHNYIYTPQSVTNSCVENWEEAHYHCNKCNTLFDGNKEPYADQSGIPYGKAPLGHDFEGSALVPEVAATCTEPGFPAYYECQRCHGKLASNDDAAKTSATYVKATPSTGHHWVSDGALGDPEPEGGKISVRCDNASCTEAKGIDYSGTFALTGTSAPTAVTIEKAGQYYIKGTESKNIWLSIPITKAGTYHVDFMNLDSTSPQRTIGFLSATTGTVQVYNQAGTKKIYGVYKGPSSGFQQAAASSDGALTGEVGAKSKDFRWFEVEAKESLVGGKIVFIIVLRSATADNPFPVVIDVQTPDDDSEPASTAAREYVALPDKRKAA